MAEKMTLTRAFRIRNLLKAKAFEYSTKYYQAVKNWDTGTEPNYRNNGGIPTATIHDRLFKLDHAQKLFNLAIARANVVTQDILITLQGLRDSKKLIESVLDQTNRLPNERQETDVEEIGGIKRTIRKTIMQSLYITDDELANLRQAIKNIEKSQFDLETQLSAINGSTNVSMVIDDEASSTKIDIQQLIDEALEF